MLQEEELLFDVCINLLRGWPAVLDGPAIHNECPMVISDGRQLGT